MKKIMPIILAVLIIITVFAGCQTKTDTTKKISVVATIFPQYDFVRQIAGDNVDLTMLLSPGEETHSYEPTPQDIIKIQNCDVFIYVGGESDEWIDGILSSINTSKMKIISLMDCVDPVEEETVKGMEHEHSDEEDTDSENSEAPEYDEHVWTSPKNVIKIVDKITEALCEIDLNNKSIYQENSDNYVDKLNQLDLDFKTVVDNSSRKTVIFGDRFPLRYFVDAYGLDYYAAFPGCSEDTEPSAATVAFLIDKVKTENIPVVFYIEFSNEKIADSICEATGAKKLLFHSCHNISKVDFESGVTYLDLMKQDVQTLKEALN